METQIHNNNKLNHSGSSGHGGVHVCHKCHWPFPNSHPSSKQRRAHKKICGTIEGYRLDNDAQDKTRVEGDTGDPNSDDELKSPRGKVPERTLTTTSSGGLDSKSSGSIISEEDVYTDANTEMNGCSVPITRLASDGVIQRFYSLQKENELDDTEPAEENAAGTDNLCTPDLLKDNKLQTVLGVEGQNDKLEAGMESQGYISTSPLVSSAVGLESIDANDQNTIQSSELLGDLATVSEKGKEITFSKDVSDIRPSYSEIPEKVAEELSIHKGASDEGKEISGQHSDSIPSEGFMKATLIETDGIKDTKMFNDVDFPEKDKTESCNEVASPESFDSPALQSQDIDSANSNIKNSDFVGDKQITFQEGDQMANANSPDVDTNILRSEAVKDMKSENSGEIDNCTKEKKPITSLENIFPESVTTDSGHLQETISSGDFNATDDGEHFIVLDNDGSKVSENNFAVRNSMLTNAAIDEVPSQALEQINTSNNTGMGNVDNMAGHSQEANLLASDCGREIGITSDNAETKACKNDNGVDSVPIDHVIHAESSNQVSAAVNHCPSEKLTEETSCISEGDDVNKQHATIPVIENIVESGSQTDSLDGNWGSVSVMSTTSDAQPMAVTDTTASSRPRSLVGEGSPSMLPEPIMVNESSQEISNFEIQASKEQQHSPTVANATDVPNRGKKDKEIMAKVTEWNSGKEHTPLKTLLGEATAKSRAESPTHQNSVIPGTKDDFSGKAKNVIINPDHPEMEDDQEEMGKEWNSPAKYPVNIKTEKRKSKSRPYWAPFFCCSSVNAR